MKKLIYLMLMVPMAFMASCSDDDVKDLPAVNSTITLSNVAEDTDGNVYAVQGDSIVVESLDVTSLNGKAASVANVRYAVNGLGVGYITATYPYLYVLPPLTFPETGTYYLEATANLLQVGKPISAAYYQIPINVVENEAALPDGLSLGQYTIDLGSSVPTEK